MIYLDSSALVKRYVSEPGSADVARAINRNPVIATSRITLVEVRAALAAARRAGRFRQRSDSDAISAAFSADWLSFIAVDVDAGICEAAAGLAERHALRGYDAVQLASALFVASTLSPNALHFGTFDDDLRHASRTERLTPLF